MNKQSKTLGLLLFFTLLFSACSSDDEPAKEKRMFSGICRDDLTLFAPANSTITMTYPTKLLSTMLPVQTYYYIPPVIGGELVISSNTFVKIDGLKEGDVLEDFKLSINGLENRWDYPIKNAGGVNTTELLTTSTMSYFTRVFDSMFAKNGQGLTVTVSYKPNRDIINNNVKLIISFDGRYNYWQKL